MVAIRFSGDEDDFATMQLCDDCLDEQDRVTVYGDYEVKPLPQLPEPRGNRNVAVLVVCATALAAAFLFVAIVGQVKL